MQRSIGCSYRRVGGADFAQLLKVELEARKLKVFLDIDNLGQGKFDEALQRSLGQSANVVLVWTRWAPHSLFCTRTGLAPATFAPRLGRGCMDRFFAPPKVGEVDFVREEYASALRLQKNIIPLYKEDFTFPKEEDMPPEVAGVMRMNAIKWVNEYRAASLEKLMARLENVSFS